MRVISVTVRSLIQSIVITTVLLSPTAGADQSPTVARIGVLMHLGDTSAEVGLREGLSELGYTEGRNLSIDWRRYEQSGDALRSIAADLVQSRVDLIVALSSQAARAALSQTSTIPVVFISADPIGAGLAANLAHPGANATGVSSQSTDLMAKRLQLLQQVAPRTRRVVMLMNPDNPLHAVFLEEVQKAAGTLRIRVGTLNARSADELDSELRRIQPRAREAFIVSSDTLFIVNKDKIGAAVRKAKLPALVPTRDYQGEGVLMSYGPTLNWMAHRAAAYADKILKGAKPGDLPIEQGSKLQLIIDLRIAHELGLKVPEELLFRADEVIR